MGFRDEKNFLFLPEMETQFVDHPNGSSVTVPPELSPLSYRGANVPPIMIINRIYENQNLLSL